MDNFDLAKRANIINEIKRLPLFAIEAARKEFGLSDPSWPPTVSGCRRLLEMARIAAKKEKKK